MNATGSVSQRDCLTLPRFLALKLRCLVFVSVLGNPTRQSGDARIDSFLLTRRVIKSAHLQNSCMEERRLKVSLCNRLFSLLKRSLLSCGLVFILFGGWNPIAHASEDSIESGRRALSHKPHLPWYDAEEDRLARIPAVLPESPPIPDRWTWTPKKRAPWNWGRWNMSWLPIVIYLLLGSMLAVLLFFLVKAAIDRAGTGGAKRKATPEEESEADRSRIEKLPFPVQSPKGDLLDEARRHADAARYREAIIYLYSYMLVQLDKHHVIRLDRGKTNRQYLRETRGRPRLRDLFGLAMVMFEDSFFGNHQIEKERFNSLWNRLDEFKQSLQE